MSAIEHWKEKGYGEIVAVEPGLGAITVRFGNGDEVQLELDALGADLTTEFEVDENGSLIARGPQGEREIDWMLIRRLDDPKFADFLRERDVEESRRIGRRLRALRENNGLSQKDAARLAQIAPSRLAKIERGETDLRVSTVRSVLRAIGGSFPDISGPDAPEMSVRQMASVSGAPRELLEQIRAHVGVRRVGEVVARGFRWEPAALLRGAPVSAPLGIQVAFKTRVKDRERATPIERLALTLSELAVRNYEQRIEDIPSEPLALRSMVLAEAGEVTLGSLTRWAWERGIVVLPMSGPGFEAASWYVEGRPVIVLKLSGELDLEVYWLFTLAHEIGHLARGHVNGSAVVEVDEPGKVEGDPQEDEANAFARELLVPEAENLFAEIRRRCHGDIDRQRRRFKWEMSDVAKKAELNPALLGIVSAFELTDIARPQDRWGSAINIAKEQASARPVVRAELKRRIDLSALSQDEAALVEAVVLE
ncbi:MAG TPA: helix-turn-helix domain-containing protein [Solirubrobacterales bacterium]|nr:helix-turn-helix domain-containing protein [Solirubrobacterales bacterium]